MRQSGAFQDDISTPFFYIIRTTLGIITITVNNIQRNPLVSKKQKMAATKLLDQAREQLRLKS
jgi:F0F1-type ATP synthase assembly protein I